MIGIDQILTRTVQVELLELLVREALKSPLGNELSSRNSFYSQNVIGIAQILTRTVQVELQELILFTKCDWSCTNHDLVRL